ncbi:hypothetical protein [Desulfovibrio sp. SGI.169]|uniref:hypothetical protein n=1 Tax=Desulfovibrio sp. SGI.169 TaxID=3420561 RepID=UPI003D07569D
MKKFWLAACCALAMALCAGTAHAANSTYWTYWQVVRDTPVFSKPDKGSKVLDTIKKGSIVQKTPEENSDPQWLIVWQLETYPGEGLIYAHLAYRTPGDPVYISAADVMEVADEMGTALKRDEAPAADTAGATSEHVHLLPMPQDADLASNGAVDEAKLKAALTKWAQNCNAVLGKYAEMDSAKAAKEVITWTNDKPFAGSAEVEGSVTPLLERWQESQYGGSENKLSADDQKIMNVLAKYGLMPKSIEGYPCLMADLVLLRKKISLDIRAYTDFLLLLDTQPQILFSDGGCRHSVKEMGTWAIEWEKYLKTVANDKFYSSEGKKRYLEFVNYILLSDLPNTPAFPSHNNGKMTEDWMEALQNVAQENQGTATAALITKFIEKVRANGNKLSPAIQKAISENLNKLFVPKTTAAEKKLLGKHMFSLQWIEGPMGTATVSSKDGMLRIDAKQKYKDDYVTLNGDVEVIDDKTFLVTGELVTRVSYIYGGEICPRNGTFTFKVTKNRKYWRLQEMANCQSHVVDYVDVYFKGL